MSFPPTLLCDFYKISHREQYPPGTESVYSTWIPRASRLSGVTEVVAFGFQAFIQEYLIDYFNNNFFDRPKQVVLDEYKRVIKYTLGVEDPDASHLEELWNLGYLPLEIKAVPEGTLVPLRVPMATIENTHPDFFWLTNYIETLFSAECWMPSTSATMAWEYRKALTKSAAETGVDPEFVPFQAHDFSMRGMSKVGAAASSGAGHLLSFTGTDTIPAILFLEQFYGGNVENELIGASIPATEHSVMCAYGQDELESFRRIITEVYPSGFVSIVSDTWDLWEVLTKVLPELKDEIMARDGKVVIRPDSGDPVDIICGTDSYDFGLGTPAHKGVIELLWDVFGGTVNDQGYKVLDPHIGAIYGDSITPERSQAISDRLKAKGFADYTVRGVGSYTYQHVTRDTFGFALKSTWAMINGEEVQIFKDPVTDDGTKKSLTGRVIVANADEFGIVVHDGLNLAQESLVEAQGVNLLKTVFIDGKADNVQTLAEIRARLLSNL